MVKKIDEILNYLNLILPEAKCELNYKTPYQLLVAVILSAQCTDKRVNQVTKSLFELAPTPKKMQDLGIDKLKQIIYPCGFYNNKAKSIIDATNDIITKFNGKVPSNMEDLTSLAGVGRKTANVVLGECFNIPSIAVDTHVLRLSKRLGLTKENSTPEKCEKDLVKIIEKEKQVKFHHQMIHFGRYYCKAQNPKCEDCKLYNICKNKKKRR